MFFFFLGGGGVVGVFLVNLCMLGSFACIFFLSFAGVCFFHITFYSKHLKKCNQKVKQFGT